MGRSKSFRKEALSRVTHLLWGEQRFQGVSLRIHGTREIRPHLLHFDVGLIDAPRVIRLFEKGSAALLYLWRIMLHPTVDRGVIDMRSPLEHHLLKISVTQWISQGVSGHTAK